MITTPLDAPKAQYVVVIVHDDYEQTVALFCEEQAAREFAPKHFPGADPSDVYIAKLI